MKRWAIYSYLLVILSLFLYSFTQIDLGLAFSKSESLQEVLRTFQNVGYFQRPLSTLIFVSIVSLLTLFYLFFLIRSFKGKLKLRDTALLISISAGILVFSYNAFSYDIFNYIFDAKIITFYHQNPYLHKALDFPGDPMLSFMQWTHRTYPYGPIWLVLTAPLTFVAQNIFIVSFFLFKAIAAAFYLGSCYLIYKSADKLIPDHKEFALVFFALNPLVIVESLVSGHNDIAMVFFSLLGIYLLLNGKKILGSIFIVISFLVKIPTLALLGPLLISIRIGNKKLVLLSVSVMIGSLFYVLTKLEMQPWYFLWVLPFVALLKPNKYILGIVVGLSLGLLLRYTPFLYTGNWNGLAPQVKGAVTLVTPVLFLAGVFLDEKLWKRS